jgi:tRNA-Thr(GGU) m(6)t(6)A37 methyltransferase TsaA
MRISLQPIGIIHSPFVHLEDMPIQPASEISAAGTVEFFEEYGEGLKDLSGFSHVILLYYFHKVSRVDLTVVPFLDTGNKGVFATRAPTRPNPIGLSVVELDGVEGTTLSIRKLDVLDGTPLLDVKPYIPEFDHPEQVRIGWLEGIKRGALGIKSDDRFA